MLQEVVLVEGEVVAALALVDVLGVGGDVVLVLLRVVGLELTLGALQLLQLTLGRLQACNTQSAHKHVVTSQ